MLVLGLIIWLVGFVTGISVLATIGMILFLVGLLMLVLGRAGVYGGPWGWY